MNSTKLLAQWFTNITPTSDSGWQKTTRWVHVVLLFI